VERGFGLGATAYLTESSGAAMTRVGERGGGGRGELGKRGAWRVGDYLGVLGRNRQRKKGAQRSRTCGRIGGAQDRTRVKLGRKS